MIVNPRFFNYRLIVGSLVMAIVILGSFGYSSYSSLNDYQQFIEHEKNLVQNELSEMIQQYDLVSTENKSINKQLSASKEKINRVLDSVKTLKPNVSLVSRYKVQLKALKRENEKVLAYVNVLKDENKSLKEQSKQVVAKLEETVKETTTLKTENSLLSKSNVELKKDLEIAKQLTITDIEAIAIKRVTSKRVIDTDYAKRAKQMQISFTITKNNFAEKGAKDIYIQILDPKSNVVGDEGIVKFGKETLIYSKKTSVSFNDNDLKVATLIKTDSGETLSKGLYFVSIFHDAKRIGKTTIELK